MVTVTPGGQINVNDGSTNPQESAAQSPEIPLSCTIGGAVFTLDLASASSNVALGFPPGITTATVIMIIALTTTDLVVNAGTVPQTFSLPKGQPMFFYGLTSAKISLTTVLGGRVQYAIYG